MSIGPFLGLNNVLPPQSLAAYEKERKAGQQLRHAVNVDIDDRGQVRRRAGSVLVEGMVGAHSLFSDGARTLYVRDSALYEITDLATFAEAALTALSSDATMRYESINGNLYFSNGTDCGRLMSGEEYPEPWSLAVPAAPSVAVVGGMLAPGNYLLSLVFATAEGEEGGASQAIVVELPAGGGIEVTLPPAAPGSAFVHGYLSAADGGAMTLHSINAVGATSVVIGASVDGASLYTEHLAPQPAGHLVASHYARLLVAEGSKLTYSEPRTPGKYLPIKNFHRFPSRITNVAPCAGGVYVTTTKATYWLEGPDVAKATVRIVKPCGASEGSAFRLPDNTGVGWYSDVGAILADEAGGVKAIQEGKVATDTADYAVLMVREAGGGSSLLAVLSGNVTPSPLAHPGIAAEKADRLHGV
jgi:hypothetical protein